MMLTALGLLALFSSTGAVPAPAVRQQLGVNIHFTGAPARDLDAIAKAGLGWVRMDLFWQRVERRRGEYDFEPYDRLLDGLDARGIRALLILDYANSLYEDGHSVRTAAGREAFARFAATAARRYRGRGVRWEIWNEPNLEGYWSPQPSVDDYIELVRAVAPAIRAADPAATIVAPASSGFPWAFLERLFAAGALDLIDDVSVHPYRHGPPETAAEDFARLRRLIAAHASAAGTLPGVISGEWGYSNAGSARVSPRLQARYLARQFLANVAEGVELSIWYDWIDDRPDSATREHSSGLLDGAHRPKPAFVAARTLTSALGDAHFVRRLDAGGDDHLLLFAGASGAPLRVAAWTEGVPHDVLLRGNVKDGEIPVTGMLGDASHLGVQDGAVELRLTEDPQYLALPAGTEAGALVAHSVGLLPLSDRLIVDVRRGGAGAAAGQVIVRAGGKTWVEYVHLDPVRPARLDVPVRWGADGSTAVDVTLIGLDGRELAGRSEAYALPAPFRDWGGGPGTKATPLSTRLDGDAAIAGTADVSRSPAPADTDLRPGPAVRLRYRLAEGWKFARVEAEGRPAIEGRPRALSLWVRGDGSDAVLRCRFRDAKGETFQPAGVPVSWTGWRRVELPLDGTTASFWGGADGKVDYPIRWDSVLLVDTSPAGGEGELLFASPLLVYPAP